MSARCRQRVEHSGVLARVFSVARPTRLTIMSGSLYVGAAAPVRTVFEVTSSGGEFDLSTIDTASLLVRFANGSAATWPATVSAATETSATLTRSHDEDDIPAGAEGTARVRADITLVGGAVLRTRWRPVEILRDGV